MLVEDMQLPIDKSHPILLLHEEFRRSVLHFKEELRKLVAAAGGVEHVARRCGMNPDNLAMLLGSDRIPHRSSLVKLANALTLTEFADIDTIVTIHDPDRES